jgi:hypothetical protein
MVEPASLFVGPLLKFGLDFVQGSIQDQRRYAQNLDLRIIDHTLNQERDESGFERNLVLEQIRSEDQNARLVLEKVLAEDQRLAQDEYDNYPIRGGVGQLRRDLAADQQSVAGHRPLLLLIPPDGVPDELWVSLRTRIRGEVQGYQDKGLLFQRAADRRFNWPHSALFVNDLYDLPTILVDLLLDEDYVDVHIGGCNLGTAQSTRVQVLRSACRLDLAPGTRAALEPRQLEDRSSSQIDASRFTVRMTAAKLVRVCVAACVDGYFVLRREGHDELLDDALAQLPDLGDPAQFDLPLDALADPAYHLLHRAARASARKDTRAAVQDVHSALSLVASVDYGAGMPMEQLIRQARDLGGIHRKHVAKATTVLQGMPPSTKGRREALAALAELSADPTVREPNEFVAPRSGRDMTKPEERTGRPIHWQPGAPPPLLPRSRDPYGPRRNPYS